MKTLIALALLQTGILIVLLFEFVVPDADNGIGPRTAPVTMSGDVRSIAQARNDFDASEAYPNEDRFRDIIRQELTAVVEALPAPTSPPGEAATPYTQAMTGSWEQRESVAQQLEYHSSVGSISASEMHRLQSDIAKLDKSSQREMLGRLTRALNSGQLEGNL